MKRPNSPCRPECPDRKPGCHNAKCRHGWAAYEVAYQQYMLNMQREKIAATEAAAYKEDRIRKQMKRKGGARCLPIR
ncbi:MAG: hypothetical protein IJV12_00420 [Acidaminococcaceae bacterium]|nr:hypothetical protein [Acidaminococcaceae bacterium]